MEICNSLAKAEFLKEKILFLDQLESYLETTNETFQNVTSLDDDDLLRVIKVVTTPGLVQDFSDLEERDFDKSDFQDVPVAAVKCLSCLKHLLPTLKGKVTSLKSHSQFFIPILKLCATHWKKFLWSSAEAVSLSQEVLDLLLKIVDCCTIGNLLCAHGDDHPDDVFKSILLSLRSSLTQETWTRNPSVCHIFHWLLLNVKHPYLSDHLSDVLPPSLMFIDHHTVDKKTLGVECLSHIIENVPSMEVKMYGRADVVYDVLHRLIYLNEPDVIDVLYPCLLTFLATQERNPHNADLPRKWGRYNDIYHQLILNMQLEERVVLRRAYSRQIPLFIDKMGITIVKHLKSTVSVLLKYLAVYDGPEEESRLNSLTALKSLIKVAWPRMENYIEQLLKRLIFLIYDIEVGSGTNVDTVKHEILELCQECMLLLKRACPAKFEKLTSDIINLEEEIPGISILKTVYYEV